MGKRIRINGKLYEAVTPNNRSHRIRMNESLGKPVDRAASRKYDLQGIELPDGSPDLYFVSSYFNVQTIVYIYGVDEDEGQLVVTVTEKDDISREYGEWGMTFSARNQSAAMKKFDQICDMVNENEYSILSIVDKFNLNRISF